MSQHPVAKVTAGLRERGVGKVMGHKVYAHESALSPQDLEALSPLLEAVCQSWNVIKLHEDTGAVTVVLSPDWDSAHEPRVGATTLVKPGEAAKVTAAQADPMIYHHKWKFVPEGYAGFSVAESRARSEEWEGLGDVDRSRIGRLSYWNDEVLPRLGESLREATEPMTDDDRDEISRAMGHRTAIARAKPSKPVRLYTEKDLLQGDVLDYGSGQDHHGYARWDPHYAPDPGPLCTTYDTVMLNYVLNVVPLDAIRSQVLSACRGLLKPAGTLLVTVWQKEDEDVKTASSYQSGRKRGEWEEFFSANGWESEQIKGAGILSWALQPEDQNQPRGTLTEAAASAASSLPATAEDVRGLVSGGDELLAALEDLGLLGGAVLHYCCGQSGHDYPKFDPEHYPDRQALGRRYDVVVLDGLHTWPEDERDEVLLAARGCMKEDAYLLASAHLGGLEEQEFYPSPRHPQGGWTGEEWWGFFRGQAWEGEQIQATEDRMTWRLQPAYFAGQRPDESGAGLFKDSPSPVYAALLTEAHALSKRSPVE